MNKRISKLVIAVALASFLVPTLAVNASPIRGHKTQTTQRGQSVKKGQSVQTIVDSLKNLKTAAATKEASVANKANFKAAAAGKLTQIKNMGKVNNSVRSQIAEKMGKVKQSIKSVTNGTLTYTDDQFTEIATQADVIQADFTVLNTDVKIDAPAATIKNFTTALAKMDNTIAKLTDRNTKLIKLNSDVDSLITIIAQGVTVVPTTSPTVTPAVVPIP